MSVHLSKYKRLKIKKFICTDTCLSVGNEYRCTIFEYALKCCFEFVKQL